MNTPNILTVIRFIIIPVFGYYLYQEQYYISISLFLLGGLTDILDGYIARKFNMITSWGKLADPLADKLLQITALVGLTLKGILPIYVLLVVGVKEFIMILGGVLLYKKQKFVVSADWYGKLATVFFYLAIVLIIFIRKFDILYGYIYIRVAIGIIIGFSLFALVMYSFSFNKIRKTKEVE